ncbi:MAG: S26 family signal peptidase [Thermoplasmatota archaeon]
MARRTSHIFDLGAAALLVGAILVGTTLWSGVWPPLVVVESSSMMHNGEALPYGRVGTINPGDIIFVKKLDLSANGGRGDVWLLGQPGAPPNYGKTGDVLIYYRDGDMSATPIIHRAIAWVTVLGTGPTRTYNVLMPSLFGMTLEHYNSSGISIGSIHLFQYQPQNSGYITKGDNPYTNQYADQAGLALNPTKPEWVEGKAVGELPWFGLIKLAVGSDLKNTPNPEDPSSQLWIRIGNVYAPSDLWVMLACSILAIVIVPLSWDVWKTARERRRAEAAFEPVVARPPVVKPLAQPPALAAQGALRDPTQIAADGMTRAKAIARFDVIARGTTPSRGTGSTGGKREPGEAVGGGQP